MLTAQRLAELRQQRDHGAALEAAQAAHAATEGQRRQIEARHAGRRAASQRLTFAQILRFRKELDRLAEPDGFIRGFDWQIEVIAPELCGEVRIASRSEWEAFLRGVDDVFVLL